MQDPEKFEDLIREKLPELLRRRPDFRYEIMGIMAENFVSRDSLTTILEKMEARQAESDRRWEELREESNRRWEELREQSDHRWEESNRRWEELREQSDRRWEESNRRWEELQEQSDRRWEETNRRLEEHTVALRELREQSDRRWEEANRRLEELQEQSDWRWEETNRRLEEHTVALRELRLEVSALSGRLGHGVEEIIRQTVEKFSGQKFKEMKHLKIKDEAGELYGVPAEVEYDLYLADTVNYVVEVKSHAKSGDVLNFYRKKVFAEAKLGKPVRGVLISASINRSAKKKCAELGIELICRSVI